MPNIVCTKCGAAYPETGMPYRCSSCEGLFDYDKPFSIRKSDLENKGGSLWQYQKSFGLSVQTIPVSLGEGKTPLLVRQFNDDTLAFKMESYNPTGSYKDRGTTLLVSELAARGIGFAVEDSSGNAGSSFATYCSWAGIGCKVFVPESASGVKLNQIARSNAILQKVPGPRKNATQAVEDAVRNIPAVYASHAYQPFLLPGIATIAYELFQDLGKVLGTVIIPVGHGGLFLGIMRGFEALYQQKIIPHLPFFIGVQAIGYHTLVSHFHPHLSISDDLTTDSLAEGVRIQQPSRFQPILKMCEKMDCDFMACKNDDLQRAVNELWKMGLYVEITSALVWAAYRTSTKKLPGPIVFIMSGTGLKY